MTDWKTRMERNAMDTVTVEEAEAELALADRINKEVNESAIANIKANEELRAKLAAAHKALEENLEQQNDRGRELGARIAALEEKEARAVLALVEGGKRIAALEAARDKALETAEEFRVERDEAEAKLAVYEGYFLGNPMTKESFEEWKRLKKPSYEELEAKLAAAEKRYDELDGKYGRAAAECQRYIEETDARIATLEKDNTVIARKLCDLRQMVFDATCDRKHCFSECVCFKYRPSGGEESGTVPKAFIECKNIEEATAYIKERLKKRPTSKPPEGKPECFGLGWCRRDHCPMMAECHAECDRPGSKFQILTSKQELDT
jgi:hypothetical protein